jgi:hypothetical protein
MLVVILCDGDVVPSFLQLIGPKRTLDEFR